MRDAILSDCGKFRYALYRVWADGLPALVFVMLNPSTADAMQDDPTIRKCIAFAKRLGYGGIAVVNLFAFRATKPADMRSSVDPIGPDNDKHIVEHCRDWDGMSDVCCAWGGNAKMDSPRVRRVLELIKRAGSVPKALALNADGTPQHPLMLSYEVDGVQRQLVPL